MGKTILVVDDEADIVATVRTVLEANGYNVISASNGDECLKILKGKKPDLILLDIMMPGLPAREVVRKVKNVKIAYLSVVRVSPAERKEMMKGGNVVDFIQKPFDIADLVDRVQKHAGKSG